VNKEEPMGKANKIIIIVSLVLSLITSVLIYAYINANKKVPAAPETEYLTVLTAAEDIPAYTEITKKHVKQDRIPKEMVNTSALTDVNEIVGKRAKESIIAGEQFLPQRLVSVDNMSLAYRIPEDTRAVSMNINEQIGVANLLRPGDYVDVVASFDMEAEISKVILQKIRVLAIGSEMVPDSDKLPEIPSTVTLAVPSGDIEKFVFASEFGTLRLALRPYDDTAVIDTHGIVRSDITGAIDVHATTRDKTEPIQ